MKIAAVFNTGKKNQSWQGMRGWARVSFVIMIIMLVFFLLIGFLGLIQSKLDRKPSSSMKKLVSSVSTSMLKDMIGIELPVSQQNQGNAMVSKKKLLSVIFQVISGINPQDPKSILSLEVPGLHQINPKQIIQNNKPSTNKPVPDTLSTSHDLGTKQLPSKTSNTTPSTSATGEKTSTKPTTIGKDIAFVYQTHSTESFLPELKGKKKPSEAYDNTINVTMVGDRLSKMLLQDGIKTIHSSTMYPLTIHDFNYVYSYKYSLNTIKQTINVHHGLQYFFDIHRDSLPRDQTTIKVKNQSYAQVYFVIGGKNPDWKENYQFASKISDTINQKIPGLSKGMDKKVNNGNAEYNQFISPTSILIEIGGPYNTLKEEYRTVDIVASAISEVILQAQQVKKAGVEQSGNTIIKSTQ